MVVGKNAKRLTGSIQTKRSNLKAALALVAAAASGLISARQAHAATDYFWYPGGSYANTTGTWSGTNWSLGATGSPTTPYTSNGSSVVEFSNNAYTPTSFTSYINANYTVGQILVIGPAASTPSVLIDATGGSWSLTGSSQYDAAANTTLTLGSSTTNILSILLPTGNSYVDGSSNTGNVTINAPISLSAAGTGVLNIQGGNDTLNGIISNGVSGTTLGLGLADSASTVTITGANTYTGATTWAGGAVQLQGASAISSTSGVTSTATGVLQLRSDTNNANFLSTPIVQNAVVDNITINVDRLTSAGASGTTLAMSGGMTFNFNNSDTTFTNADGYSLSLGAILLNTGNPGQTFTNNMNGGTTTIASYSTAQTATGNVIFNGTSATATTAVGGISSSSGNPTFVSVTQSGAGTLLITGSGNYAGSTTISNGTIVLGNASALGTAATTTIPSATTGVSVGKLAATVSSTGVLDLGGTSISGQIITLNGNGAGAGALINSGAAATIGQGNAVGYISITGFGAGTAAANPTPSITVSGTGVTNFAATGSIGVSALTTTGGQNYTTAPTVGVTGGGGTGLTISTRLSSGAVVFTITNPGTGYTSLPSLSLNGGAGDTTAATISASSLGLTGLTVSNFGTTSSAFTGTSLTATVGSTGLSTAPAVSVAPIVVNLAGSSTIGGAGNIAIGIPVIGANNLTKTGGNILSLNAVNTYSGTTTISGGTFAVNGSLTTSTITASAGELAGTGFVGTISLSGTGVLSPGTGSGDSTDIGILSTNNNGTFTGGTYVARFNGNNSAGAGSTYSQLLETATGKTIALGTSTLLSVIAYSGSNLVTGQAYPIILDTGGTLSGTFSNVGTTALTATTNFAGDSYYVTYKGGDEADLTFTAVLEPTSITGFGIAATGLLARRRKAARPIKS